MLPGSCPAGGTSGPFLIRGQTRTPENDIRPPSVPPPSGLTIIQEFAVLQTRPILCGHIAAASERTVRVWKMARPAGTRHRTWAQTSRVLHKMDSIGEKNVLKVPVTSRTVVACCGAVQGGFDGETNLATRYPNVEKHSAEGRRYRQGLEQQPEASSGAEESVAACGG